MAPKIGIGIGIVGKGKQDIWNNDNDNNNVKPRSPIENNIEFNYRPRFIWTTIVVIM